MASLKEVSIEIKGFPYQFFKRVEQSDTPLWRKDYLPFVVTFTPKNNLEVLFNQSDEVIKKLKNEYPQEIVAAGEIIFRNSDKKIDRIKLHAKNDSASKERKIWAETVVECVNPMALYEDVWIAIDQKEFYVYKLPFEWHLRHRTPEIFRVFPNA